MEYDDLDKLLPMTSCSSLGEGDLLLNLHEMTNQQLVGHIRRWKDEHLMGQYKRIGGPLPEIFERLISYHAILAVFLVEQQIRAKVK